MALSAAILFASFVSYCNYLTGDGVQNKAFKRALPYWNGLHNNICHEITMSREPDSVWSEALHGKY